MSTQQPRITTQVPKSLRLMKASPYPERYPWPGDPLQGGVPAGLGHAGRHDLRLALALGQPLDFASRRGEAS